MKNTAKASWGKALFSSRSHILSPLTVTGYKKRSFFLGAWASTAKGCLHVRSEGTWAAHETNPKQRHNYRRKHARSNHEECEHRHISRSGIYLAHLTNISHEQTSLLLMVPDGHHPKQGITNIWFTSIMRSGGTCTLWHIRTRFKIPDVLIYEKMQLRNPDFYLLR